MARKRTNHNRKKANSDRSKKSQLSRPEEPNITQCIDAKKPSETNIHANQFYLHKKFKRLVNTLEVSCEYNSDLNEVIKVNSVEDIALSVPNETDGPIPKSVIENVCSSDKIELGSNSVTRSDCESGDLLDLDNCDKSRKAGKHSCDYCGLVCAKPSVLEKHIRVHTNEKPYPCKTCNIAFKTRSNLYKHCKSQGHMLKTELQNQVFRRQSNDASYSVACSVSESSVSNEPSSPNLQSNLEVRAKPIYKPKFHLTEVELQESPSANGALPSPVPQISCFIPESVRCNNPKLGMPSPDTGPNPGPELKCSTTLTAQSESRSNSCVTLNPGRPITPGTPLSAKELKSASPEFIQQHISKIISENQAIVETFDTLWPRRLNRQNSPPMDEEEFKQQDSRKIASFEFVSKPVSLPDEVSEKYSHGKLAERQRVKETMEDLNDPITKVISVKSSDEAVNLPHLNGTVLPKLVTKSYVPYLPPVSRKRCISDGPLSVKDIWMAANSCGVKQCRYDDELDYPVSKLSNTAHPQNPEGSIIKDLLLKPRSGKQVDSCGPEPPESRESEHMKERLLLPDVAGGTYFCKSCKISYRNLEGLRVHEQFHCDGGLRPPPVTSPEEVTPYSPVIMDVGEDILGSSEGEGLVQRSFPASCEQTHPLKKRKLVESVLSVTDHSVAQLLARSSRSGPDVSVPSYCGSDVIVSAHPRCTFDENFVVSVKVPCDEKAADKPHLESAPCLGQQVYQPHNSITSVISFPHSPSDNSPTAHVPLQSPRSYAEARVEAAKALESLRCEKFQHNHFQNSCDPKKNMKNCDVPFVPGIPGPYSVNSHLEMCATALPLQSVQLDSISVVKKTYQSISSLTISSEMCNNDVKKPCKSESESDKDDNKIKKYLAPPRPTTLRLTPHLQLPKSKQLLMGTTLVSPETPRPRKSYSQIYFNGHAYTYLGLKCSTKVFFCCISHPQPMYVLQSTDPKLSMYSVWQTCPADPNPYGMNPGQSMALYNSSQQRNIYTLAKPKEVQLSVTHSSYWKLKAEKESSSESEDDETGKEEIRSPDMGSLPSSDKPKRVKIFEGGFKSNEHYTYVRGRGRGRYVCEECGIRCKKPSMLKKHIRTHTDVRPYLCRHCNFSFKTKGNLTKHMKSKAHYRKCIELSIFPVPVAIDENQQIDKDALARQERMNLEEGANENYTDSEGDEDDEDSEEDEEDGENICHEEETSASPQSEVSYPNGYSILNLSERESEVARSLLHLSQQVVMTPGLRTANTPTEEEPFFTSPERTETESPIDLSLTKKLSTPEVAVNLKPKDSGSIVSVPDNVPGLIQSIYTTSYKIPPILQDRRGSSPDPTCMQGKLYHTYLTEKALVDVRVKQQQCGKQYEIIETKKDPEYRIQLETELFRPGKSDQSRSPVPPSRDSDRSLRLTTEPGSTPNMVVGNHGLEQQGTKSSSSTLRHQPKGSKARIEEKKEAEDPCFHYNSKESIDDTSVKIFSDKADSDFMKNLSALGSEKNGGYKKLTEDGKCQCTVCDKVFQKPSQLRIHFNIHYIERPFRCESCGVSFRTKGHLQKHKRSVSHFNKVNMNMAFGIPTTDNPRPFKCTDCKIAFRIHGHLAKHLRSKMHIMRLECLGKLPFGTYAEMEKSGINLNEIDTTDCENSLESLQAMAQKFCLKDRYETWQVRERTVSGSSEEMNDLILNLNESDSERIEERHVNDVKSEPVEENSSDSPMCRVSTPCQTKVS